MKSKNMTLMLVAIGCGLVAAFLTAKLSGGSGPEKIEVVVAKKELVVGTILEEKDLDSMLATMKFDKGNLPPDVVLNVEALKGKRLNRTLKQGNYFSEGDVANDAGIKLPEGMSKYAIKIDGVKAVAGFVQAGDKVDVILTESVGSKTRSGIFLRDMLVLAVDTSSTRREQNQPAVQQINSVSLAVLPEQSLYLSSAEKRGEVKLLLRDPKSSDKANVAVTSRIPNIDESEAGTSSAPVAPVKTVKVLVAKTEVPVNTFINSDNFKDFFRTQELPEEAVFSGKTLSDESSVVGKYITNKLEADQQLFKSWLSDDKVIIDKSLAVAPPAVDIDQAELLPKPREVVAEKPLYPRKFEQIINNHRVYFIEMGPGDFRRVDGNGDELKDLPPSSGTPFKKEEKAEEGSKDLHV